MSNGNHFSTQLALLCHEKKSCLFLGLDPITKNIPHCFFSSKNQSQVDLWHRYCHFAIDVLSPFVVGIKLQSAYFEMLGADGLTLMRSLSVAAKKKKLLVLFDGKRADIPDTSWAYAKTYLGDVAGLENGERLKDGKAKMEHCFAGYWGNNIDAMTVHPFLGLDTLIPFLKTADAFGKMIFVCLKTSNKGSGALQNLTVKGEPFYLFLAKQLANIADQFSLPQSVYESLGFVVGANFPDEAKQLRSIFPQKSPFLVPGFGAQGADEKHYGDFHFAKQKLKNNDAQKKSIYRGAIYPLSRALLYPWIYSGGENAKRTKDFLI